MGNALRKSTFSKDRCKLLLSKLYLNEPEKTQSAGKILCGGDGFMPQNHLPKMQTR
jgi:hypothetical protein